MSEKFKELLTILMAYNIPFQFREAKSLSSGAWAFGYAIKNGKEVKIWEIDDIPICEDIILFREPEEVLDVGAIGLSIKSILLYILTREQEENGVDYNDDKRV